MVLFTYDTYCTVSCFLPILLLFTEFFLYSFFFVRTKLLNWISIIIIHYSFFPTFSYPVVFYFTIILLSFSSIVSRYIFFSPCASSLPYTLLCRPVSFPALSWFQSWCFIFVYSFCLTTRPSPFSSCLSFYLYISRPLGCLSTFFPVLVVVGYSRYTFFHDFVESGAHPACQ